MPATEPPTPRGPATGTPVTAVCREVVADLAARWELASVHLVLDGRLRCLAAEGHVRLLEGPVPERGLVARVLRTGLAAACDDVPAETGLAAPVSGVVSQAVAPVLVGGRCAGVVSIEGRAALGPRAAADVRAAATRIEQVLADLGGVPVAPVGQRLARLAVDLGAEPEVERLRRLVVEGATGVAGRSSAALVAVSPGGRWEVTASTGPLAQAISQWSAAELEQLGGWVSAGASAHVPGGTDLPADLGFLPRAGVRSMAVHPLVAGGTLFGLLAVADADPYEHDPVAVAALEVVAGLAASSLRTAGLLREHADRAREALTGVADAAQLRADLTDFCVAAIQTGEVTHTCMLLDATAAAPADDGPGREVGDDVLSALVEALNGQLRHGDSLYRLAGAEFAVLLATGLPESATAVADRLVRAAREAGAPVSLGWALVDGPPAAVQERAAAALGEARACAAQPEDAGAST